MAKLLICLLCSCCLVVEVFAVPRSAEALTLCYEDQNSYPWVTTNPAYAARIWDEIERQRESVTYQQQVRAFLARSQP